MKNIKKFFILLMASTFIFAMSITAFGAPADGSYAIAVTLAGGSGKASIQSAELTVSGGQMTAKITMSSTTYTYMVVNGTQYNNQAAAGANSAFVIPVAALDTPLSVSACTVAMSEPKVIDYTLTFNSSSLPASNTSQPTTAAANSGSSSNGGANSSATTSNNGGASSETTVSQEETTTTEETVTVESATDETESSESKVVGNNKESKSHTIAIVITIIVIIIVAALAVLIYKKRDRIFKRRDQ
jgi:hypothetical protein